MIQLQNDATADSLANEVARAAKLKQWHVYTGIIDNKAIRVKAYGLWLQIFDIDGVQYASPEFKTQKELKAYIIESIQPNIARVRKIKAYCEKGNGIYCSFGGRYFDARVNADGKLECFDGYDNNGRNPWLVIENPESVTWWGPHNDKVFIN